MDDGVFRWVMVAGFVAVVAVIAPHRVKAATNEKLDRRKEGAFMLATLHPSALLRIRESDARHAAFERFVADLALANAALHEQPS